MSKPIVWTIAGSDSGGGAGIQADLHTFQTLNTHGCSVITAITAQNSFEVTQIEWVSPDVLTAQIETLFRDLPPKAIKLGMLGNIATMEKVALFLQQFSGYVVCDPVMVSTSGAALFASAAKTHWIEKIFPHVDLITPNIPEAAVLTGLEIKTSDEVETAAKHLLNWGIQRVFIKGGHHNGEYCQDYYLDREQSFWLTSPRQPTQHTHGSGCTLSAAIAANLAQGHSMADALVIAKMYVNQALRHARPLGQGVGPVAHLPLIENDLDFPWLTISAQAGIERPQFPDCGEILGLYPVVDSSEWLQRLLPFGVKTIQLRIKAAPLSFIEQEIKTSIAIAKKFKARLFINDYWEFAIKHGAYGIHLGQEDLLNCDYAAILQSGLRLGISTHDYSEVARAHALRPSYLACGPVFPTTSKVMPFAPQGLINLQRWCNTLKNYPWVAIGGISTDKLESVLNCGVSGVAVVSAITKANNPEFIVSEWLKRINHLKLNPIFNYYPEMNIFLHHSSYINRNSNFF